jgi:nicotinate-nucleotide--dimethylbenzimidazole phosphoribosyltransferase
MEPRGRRGRKHRAKGPKAACGLPSAAGGPQGAPGGGVAGPRPHLGGGLVPLPRGAFTPPVGPPPRAAAAPEPAVPAPPAGHPPRPAAEATPAHVQPPMGVEGVAGTREPAGPAGAFGETMPRAADPGFHGVSTGTQGAPVAGISSSMPGGFGEIDIPAWFFGTPDQPASEGQGPKEAMPMPGLPWIVEEGLAAIPWIVEEAAPQGGEVRPAPKAKAPEPRGALPSMSSEARPQRPAWALCPRHRKRRPQRPASPLGPRI